MPRQHAPLASWMLAASPALAGANGADAADVGARALAAGCRSCHQPGESIIPSLDEQTPAMRSPASFARFAKARCPAPSCLKLAKGYTDAELDAIARYFAATERP